MTKPTWVLETNVFETAHFDRMVAQIKALDCPLQFVRVKPFEHVIVGKKPEVAEGPVIVYGSIGVEKVARENGWSPGTFSSAEMFNYEAYQEALGDLMLNSDARRMRFRDVQSYLVGTGREKPFFIKPNGDDKQFAGALYTPDEFADWHAKMQKIGYFDTEEFDVILSEPKSLGCEWRLVVVDGEIVSSSLYRQYDTVRREAHSLPEVVALVEAAHLLYVPAPVYVIDVAQHGDAFKIVEYNAFNTAGFYAGDIEGILTAVTAYVERTTS